MKQTVEPVATAEWYGSREWNVGIWGTYVWAGNGPFGAPEEGRIIQPGAAPFQSITGEIDSSSHHGDQYLGASDGWGGGVDLKYFVCRYFGIGVEGYGLAAHRDAPDIRRQLVFGNLGTPAKLSDEDVGIGSALGTLTVRYPIGRFAPYAFAGAGGVFGGGDVKHVDTVEFDRTGTPYGEIKTSGDSTAAVGQFGGGLEVRFTRHVGLVSDVSWNVVDGPHNNFGMVRTGLNFAF
jgi:hypothetical protein